MSSKFFLLRNFKRPVFFYNKELNSKLYKTVYFDFYNSNSSFLRFKLYLNFTSNSSKKSRIRPYCVHNGRTRSVDSDFSFSRFSIKSSILKGCTTGYKKSSW